MNDTVFARLQAGLYISPPTGWRIWTGSWLSCCPRGRAPCPWIEIRFEYGLCGQTAGGGKSLYTAEVTKRWPNYIPTVRVQEITWSAAAGKLTPKVVITNA